MTDHEQRDPEHEDESTFEKFERMGRAIFGVNRAIKDPLLLRSATASTFTAGLELAKQGKLEIRQDGLFRPIYLRSANRPPLEDAPKEIKEEGTDDDTGTN